ncbi:MAG: RNA polymerase sigma factor [Planctomycetota bacterium]
MCDHSRRTDGSPEPEALPAHLDPARLEPPLVRARAEARRLLGCDHLADDAVQEALLALLRVPAPPPDVAGWLVLAVRHRARHMRRTLERRLRHEHHAGAARCADHPACENPLHHAHSHEIDALLAGAIERLPAEQRRVFLLYSRTGLDYDGVARELALPVGTVRSRLHRARRALQTALHGHGPD